MLDRSLIGTRLPTREIAVEEGQMRFFTDVIGETDPVHRDEGQADARGFVGLPVPPTYAFTLNMLASAGPGWLDDAGIDIANVLHGSQEFEYFRPILVGDVISFASRIADIYDKKGGALEFIVIECDAVNQHGELCVRQRISTVVRAGGSA